LRKKIKINIPSENEFDDEKKKKKLKLIFSSSSPLNSTTELCVQINQFDPNLKA
jgi:hypothetical protein